MAVILDKNRERIRAVYTTIEGRFSDIFFFDVDFLKQLENKVTVSGNEFDGMFVEWLTGGKIEYDPKGLLLAFKSRISKDPPKQKISDSEKEKLWIKVNYNFIANSRYHRSGKKLYHQALELRLLYSVSELVSAYFSFRGVPWRGEKAAVEYFEKNDQEFLSALNGYFSSNQLEDEMRHYNELFYKVFSGKYQKWPDNFIISMSDQDQYEAELPGFLKEVFSR